MSNILQSSLAVDFLYPLLLMFFISFALLEKTKLFGDNKAQLNAFISLFVSLVFVGAVFPVIVVNNLLLYMGVGLVVVFVGLVLWGFVNGDAQGGFSLSGDGGRKIHKLFVFLIFGSLVFAILWATGYGSAVVTYFYNLFSKLFLSSWSANFWTNFVIVGIILALVAAVLGWNPFKANPAFWWVKLGK